MTTIAYTYDSQLTENLLPLAYHLYRNDSLILDTKDLTFYKEELLFDKVYTYRIASYDKEGDDGPA